MAEYTRGKWEAVEYPGGGVELYENGRYVAGFDDGNDGLLTQVAVNACISLNPENPIAVAEGIGDTIEACKEYDIAIGKFIMALANGAKLHEAVLPLITPAQDKGRHALSKITGGK